MMNKSNTNLPLGKVQSSAHQIRNLNHNAGGSIDKTANKTAGDEGPSKEMSPGNFASSVLDIKKLKSIFENKYKNVY